MKEMNNGNIIVLVNEFSELLIVPVEIVEKPAT
jgi:hypothetical protein